MDSIVNEIINKYNGISHHTDIIFKYGVLKMSFNKHDIQYVLKHSFNIDVKELKRQKIINDFVSKTVDKAIKLAELNNNPNDDCIICYNKTINRISCCNAFICLECYGKMGKCAQCRHIYNEQINNQISSVINHENHVYMDNMTDNNDNESEEDEDNGEYSLYHHNESNTPSEAVIRNMLEYLNVKLNKLLEDGTVIRTGNGNFNYVHPITHTRSVGNYGKLKIQKLMIRYINNQVNLMAFMSMCYTYPFNDDLICKIKYDIRVLYYNIKTKYILNLFN
jgi:hypothetical protein